MVGATLGLELGAECEHRGQPAGEVRAEARTRASRAKRRPVLDEVLRAAGAYVQPIVALRKPPYVVVADDLLAAVTDTDLIEQCLRLVEPHLVEPAQPVHRLPTQPLVARPLACRDEQQRIGVRRRLHELEVVTGVEPATTHINGAADPVRPADETAVSISRLGVRTRTLVAQMARLAAQLPTRHVGPVALSTEEGDCMATQRSVQLLRRRDLEPRRSCPGASPHTDPVRASPMHPTEADRVHVTEVLAPSPDVLAESAATYDLASAYDCVARVRRRTRRHHVRGLRLVRRPTHLIDAHESPVGGCLRRLGLSGYGSQQCTRTCEGPDGCDHPAGHSPILAGDPRRVRNSSAKRSYSAESCRAIPIVGGRPYDRMTCRPMS